MGKKQLHVMQENMYKILEDSIIYEFFKKKQKKEPKMIPAKEVKDAINFIRSEMKKLLKKHGLKNARILSDVDTYGNYDKDQEEFESFDDFGIFRIDLEDDDGEKKFKAFFKELSDIVEPKYPSFALDVEYDKYEADIFLSIG